MNLFFSVEFIVFFYVVFTFIFSVFLSSTEEDPKPSIIALVFLFIFNILISINYLPISYFIVDPNTFISSVSSHFYKTSFISFFFLFMLFGASGFKRIVFNPETLFFYNMIFTAGIFLIICFDFMTVFLLLEIVSLPSYVLIALNKDRFAVEAAIKYLIYGSFASLTFIFSFITFAHFTGSTFSGDYLLFKIFSDNSKILEPTFYVFFIITFFIKFGVGPSYAWVPDVYQAANYPTFVYLSTVGKLALAFPLINFYFLYGNFEYKYFALALLIVSAYSGVYGLFVQQNFRRIFAYSSVINLSLALSVLFVPGSTPMDFYKYLFFYSVVSFFTYLTFGIYNQVTDNLSELKVFEDFKTFKGSPATNLFGIAIFLNSGLPPFGLFYAKAYVYGTLIASSDNLFYVIISVFFVFNSIIALFAYFRIISRIFDFANPRSYARYDISRCPKSYLGLVIAVLFFIIWLSFYWNYFINLLKNNKKTNAN